MTNEKIMQAIVHDTRTKECLDKTRWKYEAFSHMIDQRRFPSVYMARYITPRSKYRERRRLQNLIQQTPA